ncbi:MAG: BMP family ABC transporter substrate-binding protein [Clostridiales Family XIII bacterium]|jgi:basic membrane protein A|nr:BMP family ABC transporter substrate-binding protein [Clostridiales Family XIII bacterium]
MKLKSHKSLLVLLALIMTLSFTLGACGGSSDDEGSAGTSADALKIGWIYIGTVNDGGYTQAQNAGKIAVEDAFGDRVETAYLEEIDDTNTQESKEAAIQLIDQGCKVIIGTSFGFGAALTELANSGDYDDVIFLHFSDPEAQNDTNLADYFGAMEEPRYLSGIIAGMQTESNKLGYVAAFPYTEVQIGIDAFTLGAQSVNPDVEVNVVYINSWYDPSQEKAAAEALLAQGCDVITQHADTTSPQQAAADAGKLTIGYNLDNSKLEGLEDAFLTAPIWNHGAYLVPTVQSILDGTWTAVGKVSPFGYYGTISDGFVDLAPLTDNVSDEAKAKVEEVKALMESGEFKVFTGPILDSDNNEVVKDGEVLTPEQIWQINYEVKGVKASGSGN